MSNHGQSQKIDMINEDGETIKGLVNTYKYNEGTELTADFGRH